MIDDKIITIRKKQPFLIFINKFIFNVKKNFKNHRMFTFKLNYKYIHVYIDDELVDSWSTPLIIYLKRFVNKIVSISEMV